MPAVVTEEPDLSGVLLVHAGLRQEFRRLAVVAREPLDAGRAGLAEEQIAMAVDALHRHHRVESQRIRPLLRQRVPACAGDLAALEEDRARLDPLLSAVAAADRPLRDRADLLHELHELLTAHLDREEAITLPLLRTCVSLEDWADVLRHAKQETLDLDLPRVLGWLADAATDDLRAAVVGALPAPVRVLFRVFWWPSYQRRALRLYGAGA